MGIRDLNKLLKDNCPEVFKVLPLSLLKGRKVAIDAHNVMYTTMAIVHKTVLGDTNVILEAPDSNEITSKWIKAMLDFAGIWLKQKATPIFIFDGKPVAQKAKAWDERKEAKLKKIKDIAEYKDSIDSSDALSHTPAMLSELRKKMSHITEISKDQQAALISVFKALKIPCREAKYDGEQLCSMLCREKEVAAVYSKDTDNLVYGCPLLLTGFSFSKKDEEGVLVPYYEAINYSDILKGLGLKAEEFTDLCITLGCDFNQRIPLIGPVKGLKLIKAHGTIDKYPVSQEKLAFLDHLTCRKIFSTVKAADLVEKNLVPEVDLKFEGARDLLEVYELSGYINVFFTYYSNLPGKEANTEEKKEVKRKKAVFILKR